MAIFNNFITRKKEREKTGQPDVYVYDALPEALRVQIIYIWDAAIGQYNHYDREASMPSSVWQQTCLIHARETGRFFLGRSPQEDPSIQCKSHLMATGVDDALSLIELSFIQMTKYIGHFGIGQREYFGISQNCEDAIEELNGRFRMHGVGYQFEGGQLVTINSEFVHAKIVRPALTLLHTKGFEGAEEEFRKAHKHYREGQNKEAINEALKAFESTMKTICKVRRWPLNGNEPAQKLIETLVANGLIETHLQAPLIGLATIRNRNSGHGQGATPVTVPSYLAAYALHQAAANIVFLVEAHKAMN